MELLNNVIAVMNKEEIRNFKLWLNSTNASEARKDVVLFDYIRKSGEKYDEDFVFKKLYTGGDKNSFYRLKNRLLEDIGYNLCLLHFGKQEPNNLYLFLSLFNIFLSRNQPQTALYFLKKAEKKAAQIENLEMLDIIYGNYVKIAADMPDINPEVYIQKRKENALRLNKIRETDQVLAAVTYRLKLTQNYGKRDAGLLKVLDNTIKEFAEDDSLKYSKTFQTRVFRAVSQTLIQNHNFIELEKFMEATYKRFIDEKWFDKNNHETKLQMLIYMVNAQFKNRKYHESLDSAETLGEEMAAFNAMLYNKYLFFYYNALVINYAHIDITRGLRALDEMEKEIKGLKNPYYEFFILWNKATLLFSQGKFDEAIRNLVRLFVNGHYKKADVSLKLKIGVAECIMQYESGDYDTTLKRVEQVRKQFAQQLLAGDYKRELVVLKFLPRMIEAGGLEKDKKLVAEVKKFVNTSVSDSIEDGEVLRYRAWLQPKVAAGT